jgi:hypothetical protein
VGTPQKITRRLYVDLQVNSVTVQIILIEFKGLASSHVHEFAQLYAVIDVAKFVVSAWSGRIGRASGRELNRD